MKIVSLVFCFVSCLFISSCNSSDEIQIDKSGSVSDLKIRVDSRWKSMMSQDYEKVYEFFSPEYRRLNDYNKFESTVGDSVEWLSVKIDNVKIEDGYASVFTKIVYRLRLPGSAGSDFGADIGDLEKTAKESWVWRSNQWWFAGQFKGGL